MKGLLRQGSAVLLALIMVITFMPMAGTTDRSFAAAKGGSSSAHLNRTSVSLVQGNSVKLKVKKLGKNAKGKKPKVTWSTGNSKVATVSKKGKVKATGGGQAVITATIKYSKKKRSTLTCKVSVLRRSCYNARKVWEYVNKKGTYRAVDVHEDGYIRTVGDFNKGPSISIDTTLGLDWLEFYYGSRKPATSFPDYDTVYMDSQLMNNRFNNNVYVEVELSKKEMYTLCGKIYGNYNGGTTGIVFNSVQGYSGDKAAQILQAHRSEAIKSVGRAFKQFNAITKKTGYTMQQIGFYSWK